MTTLICDVVGLPPPDITFEKDNDDSFSCRDSCTISGPNLTFTNPTSTDSGVYGCAADNDRSPAVGVSLSLKFCGTLPHPLTVQDLDD